MTQINTPSSRRSRNWCKDDKNVLTLRESIMCHQHVDIKSYVYWAVHRLDS